MLTHRWWREKSKDESKYENVTLLQLEDYAQALEREIVSRDIKIPVFNDEMPTIRKAWSESAREAALEARRAKAKPSDSVSGHSVRLHYALIPKETIDKLKKDFGALPPEHTKNIEDLTIQRNLGRFEWQSEGRAKISAPTAGDYDAAKGEIRITSGELESGRGQRVLYHEIGHNVYDRMMRHELGSVEAPTEWDRLWSEHKQEMPSSYARSHPTEGFAECYKEYQTKKPLAPAVEDWFKANVKRKGD